MRQLNNWHDRHSLARPNYLSRLPQVELEITRGRARNRVRPMLGATFLIGAGRQCDLVLGDSQFEEVHGYLLLGTQGLVLRHLGFEPELTVNGRPVRKVVLWNQARIRTGPFEFRVHIRAAEAQGDLGRGWDGAELAAPSSAWGDNVHGSHREGAPLRVFRGLDERRIAGGQSCIERRVSMTGRRPPLWRHLSELILSS